jgi:cytosine/creatinine deaminase
MPDFITIPASTTSFRLTNARVPVCLVGEAGPLTPDADGLAPCDIVIDNGRIAAIGPAVQDGLARFDLDRGIVLPRLVDVHTHIDKGHIWARAQNPDGTHLGARTAVMADREANWSRDDVQKRMDFALRCAFAHGTGALRTHIDSYPKQTPISWPLFAEMREQWKGRITLQAVSLYTIDVTLSDEPVFRAMV